ncbi:MAG: amidohydrolase family protein [Candidatus Hydrogenedentes bacterium]|nr:amidohydrolase family protein [Candidatus Hydrogenedentota bacterium]
MDQTPRQRRFVRSVVDRQSKIQNPKSKIPMVIDCHMHVRAAKDGSLDTEYCDATIEAGDLLGIDLFCVVDLQLTGPLTYVEFHAANERVKQAIARHPTRYRGYCYVNPSDPKALDEIRERVKNDGFIGVKLYNQHFIDDDVVAPVLKLASEWQIPVLSHAGRPNDPVTQKLQPHISDAARFVRVAQRFPELILIEGHIGGGGDWEWALKHLRESETVYLDTSGSVIDEWMVDRAVEAVGVDRLLFATDMTMEGGVGKILDANLTDEERARVLGANFEAILRKRAVP